MGSRAPHGPRRAWLVFALACSLLAVLLTAAPSAVAQDAAVLFEQGLDAMDKGRYNEACALFSRAYEAEKKPAALLNLAACEEARGNLVLAREQWKQGLDALDANDSRRSIAQVHIEDLGKRIPQVTVISSVEGAVVMMDGVTIGLGSPVHADPGKRVFVLHGLDGELDRTTIELAEGERRMLRLEERQSKPAPSPAPSSPPSGAPEPSSGAGLQLAGAVVLAVGAAGFVAFAFTGGLYLDNKSSIDEACPDKVCPNDALLADTEVLDTLGIVNVIGLSVGVIGAATGAILLWQGSSGDEAVSMSVGPAGVLVRGTF